MGMFDPNITYTVDGVEIDPATQALPASFRADPMDRYNRARQRYSTQNVYTDDLQKINQWDWMQNYVNENNIAWNPAGHLMGSPSVQKVDPGTAQALAAWREFKASIPQKQQQTNYQAYKKAQAQAKWDALSPEEQAIITARQEQTAQNKDALRAYLSDQYGIERQQANELIRFMGTAFPQKVSRSDPNAINYFTDLNTVKGYADQIVNHYGLPQMTGPGSAGTWVPSPYALMQERHRNDPVTIGRINAGFASPKDPYQRPVPTEFAQQGRNIGGFTPTTRIPQTGGLTPAAYQQQPTPFSPTVKPPFGRADGTAQDFRGQPQTMFGQNLASASIAQNNLLNVLNDKIRKERSSTLKNLFGI